MPSPNANPHAVKQAEEAVTEAAETVAANINAEELLNSLNSIDAHLTLLLCLILAYAIYECFDGSARRKGFY